MRWVEAIYNIALHGSLLPMHLEHRQAARSASEQESVASRCATAAAAFVATRSFNGWRCCPTPPLYKAQLGRAFSLRSPLRAGDTLSSPSFPNQGALALFALRQSGFVANGTRRLTFFATPSTADNGTAVRAVIGRVRNRILRQLPDLYAFATPHSLRSTVSATSPGPGAAYALAHTPSGKPLRNRPMLQLPLCCRPLVPSSARA